MDSRRCTPFALRRRSSLCSNTNPPSPCSFPPDSATPRIPFVVVDRGAFSDNISPDDVTCQVQATAHSRCAALAGIASPRWHCIPWLALHPLAGITLIVHCIDDPPNSPAVHTALPLPIASVFTHVRKYMSLPSQRLLAQPAPYSPLSVPMHELIPLVYLRRSGSLPMRPCRRIHVSCSCWTGPRCPAAPAPRTAECWWLCYWPATTPSAGECVCVCVPFVIRCVHPCSPRA